MSDLRDLLHDAVADVEPEDRLDLIRARTAHPSRAARPWWYAAGGVAIATAATVAAFAVLGDDAAPPADHHHDLATEPSATPGTRLVPAYFIGDTPSGGPRLFREFDARAGTDPIQGALDRIQRPPADPDYRTAWPTGSFGEVRIDATGIQVDVADPDADLADDLAVQQVVYTLQAAAGERLPVWFRRDGQRVDTPVTAAPAAEVLNPVSISDPAEGNEYAGAFIARGRATGDDRLRWALTALSGAGPVVRDGRVRTADRTASGAWTAEIDLQGLDPGTYLFVVRATSWADGVPATDTRTIVIR